MLSNVHKYIDSLSSIPHLEALQEASRLFEKEREPWKQERLALRNPGTVTKIIHENQTRY